MNNQSTEGTKVDRHQEGILICLIKTTGDRFINDPRFANCTCVWYNTLPLDSYS